MSQQLPSNRSVGGSVGRRGGQSSCYSTKPRDSPRQQWPIHASTNQCPPHLGRHRCYCIPSPNSQFLSSLSLSVPVLSLLVTISPFMSRLHLLYRHHPLSFRLHHTFAVTSVPTFPTIITTLLCLPLSSSFRHCSRDVEYSTSGLQSGPPNSVVFSRYDFRVGDDRNFLAFCWCVVRFPSVMNYLDKNSVCLCNSLPSHIYYIDYLPTNDKWWMLWLLLLCCVKKHDRNNLLWVNWKATDYVKSW